MATIRFRGDAPAVAQVTTTTVTAYDAATTYKVTINGKIVSVVGITDANTTAAALQAALAASLIAEFLEVTWTVASAVITGTAFTAGVPFTFTTSVSGGTGTIGAATTTTVSSGPYDASTLANYSAGALAIAGDILTMEGPATILYNLTQYSATAVNFQCLPSWTGSIGLPDYNANGYFEYRQKYLQTTGTSFISRAGQCGRIKLDFGNTASVTVTIYAAGNPLAGDPYAINIIKTGASSTYTIQQGVVGIAMGAGETATVTTLNIGSLNNPASDVTVTCGLNVGPVTINQNGGNVTVLNGTVGTWNFPSEAGIGTLQGQAAITTLTMNSQAGCTLYWQSAGTIATATIGPKATIDASQAPIARTMTNCTMESGAALLDPAGLVTFTNPILLGPGVGVEDITIQAGKNRHIQFS